MLLLPFTLEERLIYQCVSSETGFLEMGTESEVVGTPG